MDARPGWFGTARPHERTTLLRFNDLSQSLVNIRHSLMQFKDTGSAEENWRLFEKNLKTL